MSPTRITVTLPDGTRVTGTPDQVARLLELTKSATPPRPTRSPQWVDKTGDRGADA